jgi:hypothetical protein
LGHIQLVLVAVLQLLRTAHRDNQQFLMPQTVMVFHQLQFMVEDMVEQVEEVVVETAVVVEEKIIPVQQLNLVQEIMEQEIVQNQEQVDQHHPLAILDSKEVLETQLPLIHLTLVVAVVEQDIVHQHITLHQYQDLVSLFLLPQLLLERKVVMELILVL